MAASWCDPEEVFQQWRSFVRVVRVASEEHSYSVCSASAVAVRVHWYRRRTVPCVSAIGSCPACSVVARPQVFVGVQVLQSSKVTAGSCLSPASILELPVSAWGQIRQFVKSGSALCGVSFTAYRHGGKRGKVLVNNLDQQPGHVLLSEREMVCALCRLWQVPAPRVGETDSDWLTRVGVAVACDGHYRPEK